jgi:hypothetical protein
MRVLVRERVRVVCTFAIPFSTLLLALQRARLPADLWYFGYDDTEPFKAYYQPIVDQIYTVQIIDTVRGQSLASYTVTVFGVDGLPYGPLANLGRRISSGAWGPSAPGAARAAAAKVGEGLVDKKEGLRVPERKGVAAQGATVATSDTKRRTTPLAPTMPEGWGQ